MATTTYDIITVGGGLGGASLAKAMAEHGAKVLVLERETRFKDRVRGEVIWSWGVAELRELGSHELLRNACGADIFWFDTYLGPVRVDHQDLVGRTMQHIPALNFSHPDMQEVLLHAAEHAGAANGNEQGLTEQP
jgi:flavin-dependent dehydrogenase